MNPKLIPILFVVGIVGCNSNVDHKRPVSTTAVKEPPLLNTAENLPIPDNHAVTEYNILFMGNSHVTGLAEIIAALFEISETQKNIGNLTVSSGGFLAERLDDGQSIGILKNNTWTHVIFQAQKYSQSGQIEYPTVAAQTWIQMAKTQNATPILFPEHPQRGKSKEGQKVHDLHVSIANIQSSCVAPVGLVWDRVIRLMPNLALHQADGNHASSTGTFLTALVFYQTISGNSADLIPFISSIDIDEATQDFLGQITSEVMASYPPCEY